MPATKILVYGDTHVDDRMQLAGMQPMTAEGEPLVLAQARAMMTWVGQVARERGAQLILHTGDVYERPRPSPAAEDVVVRALVDHGEVAPELVLLGNHDRPIGYGTHALEPLKSLRPERIQVADAPGIWELWSIRDGRVTHLLPGRVDGGAIVTQGSGTLSGDRLLCAVVTLPYPARSGLAAESESRDATNAAITAALDGLLKSLTMLAGRYRAAGVPVVLAGHGTLRGARYDSYQTVPLSDVGIPTETFDQYAVALFGHLHLRQPAPGAGWPSHYIGSPDRQDFGEEGGDHGVSLVTLTEDGRVEVEFIAYPAARRFLTVDVAAVLAQAGVASSGQTQLALGEVARNDSPAAILGLTEADRERVVMRIAGSVTDEDLRLATALVRRWRTSGWTVANACTVERQSRARVEVDAGASPFARGIAAVFAARPDLVPHRDEVLAQIGELRPTWGAL
jgi:hypothetical protein